MVLTKLRWFELGNRVSDKQWNDIVQMLEIQHGQAGGANLTTLVYTFPVKNVTISLDDHLLERCREFARTQGKSFNELVRDLLRTTVDDRQARLKEAWDYADRLHLRLDGPLPGRTERNARN